MKGRRKRKRKKAKGKRSEKKKCSAPEIQKVARVDQERMETGFACRTGSPGVREIKCRGIIAGGCVIGGR